MLGTPQAQQVYLNKSLKIKISYVLHCVKLYSFQIQLQQCWDLVNWWDILFLTIEISSWTLFYFKMKDLVGRSIDSIEEGNQRARSFSIWLIYRMIMIQFFFLMWVQKQNVFWELRRATVFNLFLLNISFVCLYNPSHDHSADEMKIKKKYIPPHSHHNDSVFILWLFSF